MTSATRSLLQAGNPHAAHGTALTAILQSFWRNRELIAQMTKREVIGRYRGSVMGLAWSFFNPILMLAVYTFVFSVVFKARWGMGNEESKASFAIILFVGMIVHGLFAECVNRAPGLILSNVNYVKKVVFPLVILPLLIATMGLAWILSATGVFVRDIAQTTGIITTVLLFVSPVFYPVSALPKEYQGWLLLNPLTFVIEEARNVLIWGRMPDWPGWGLSFMVGLTIAWAGFWWFQKTRKGFADVL